MLQMHQVRYDSNNLILVQFTIPPFLILLLTYYQPPNPVEGSTFTCAITEVIGLSDHRWAFHDKRMSYRSGCHCCDLPAQLILYYLIVVTALLFIGIRAQEVEGSFFCQQCAFNVRYSAIPNRYICASLPVQPESPSQLHIILNM